MEEKKIMPNVVSRQISKGQYGITYINEDGHICVDSGIHTPEELREAAHVLNQIAEYLESEGK